jgi:cytochrome c biogenesis protein CcmG/thiol:disulfide interchange protein DsbE
MPRRLLYLLPMLLFVGIAGYFLMALQSGRNPGEVPSVLVDHPAPAFTLAALRTDVPGLSRQDLGGQVALVNFFASWCVPCRAEHAMLMKLTREAQVPIFGVAYKDKPEAARAFLDDLGNPYARIGMDENGRTAIDFGVTGVPETFVIDRDGRIRYRQWGPITEDAVNHDLLPLLAKLRQ